MQRRLWVVLASASFIMLFLFVLAAATRPSTTPEAFPAAAPFYGPLDIPFDRNLERYPPPDNMAMAPAASSDITETHEGFTLRIQPVHADSNRVVVRYAVDTLSALLDTEVNVCGTSRGGPMKLAAGPCTLRAGGQDLRLLENKELRHGGGPFQDHWQVEFVGTLTFDATALRDPSAPLSLHLYVPWQLRYDNYLPPWPNPTNAAGLPITVTPAPTNTPIPPLNMRSKFDFPIPFDARARIASPEQESVSGSMTMTLQTVVSTESETRLVFRFHDPSASNTNAGTAVAVPAYWHVWLRPTGSSEDGPGGDSFQAYLGAAPQCDSSGECAVILRYNGDTLLNSPQQDFTVTLHLGMGEQRWLFNFKLPPLAEPKPR